MPHLIRPLLAVGTAAGALLLAGCVVSPAPYYNTGNPDYGAAPGYGPAPGYGAAPGYGYGAPADYSAYDGAPVYAPSAPPAPVAEVQPALPFTGAIWIGGFWNWSGGRYAWVPGRYERPRAGYSWEPRRWTKGSGGRWQLNGGWRRR